MAGLASDWKKIQRKMLKHFVEKEIKAFWKNPLSALNWHNLNFTEKATFSLEIKFGHSPYNTMKYILSLALLWNIFKVSSYVVK